jgi:hypothetical protein
MTLTLRYNCRDIVKKSNVHDWCSEPGHTSRDCPRRIDVRGLSANEREELFQDLLAAKDAVTEEPSVIATVETEGEEEEEKSQPAGFAHRDG